MNGMDIRALVFDVFGTVVDWRGSIILEGEAFGRKHGFYVDWPRFADEWRAGYQPALDMVRRGERAWTKLDVLHRERLNDLLVRYSVRGLDEHDIDHLNRVWHRLQPWSDVIEGLNRLRTRFVVATLSNGHVALLTHMAKHAGLPWDCILSAELAKTYKPDPVVYLTAVELLDLEPSQVMMVAAHGGDLQAAQRVGLRTAFVYRPLEYGPDGKPDRLSEADVDLVAEDFLDLAEQLKA